MTMQKRKGFTLIELLVAIAIIGILSTVAVVSLTRARRQARDTRRVADVQQLRNALVLYSNQRGDYPAGGAGGAPLTLGRGAAQCLNDSGFQTTCSASSGLIIMNRVPAEQFPVSPIPEYTYTYGSTTSYTITFGLEGSVASLSGGMTCSARPEGITCP